MSTVSSAMVVSDKTTTQTQGVIVTSTEIPSTLGQAVVPTLTDQASLTSQATQAVVAEATYQPAQEALVPIQNPYPSQTPVQLLSRQYKVAEFDFTPAFTVGQVRFPLALFAQQTIANAMSSFCFWRGDVKVHIKMQSVPQQRGALMVSWMPCTSLAPASISKVAASCNHMTILNVSTSDTATFVIPYLSPKAWLPYPEATATDHSSLYFHTLVPLSAPTGITNVVKFTVYASFHDPKVAGFQHTDAAQSMAPVSKVLATINPLVKTLTDLAGIVEPALGVLNLLDKPDMSTRSTYVVPGGTRVVDWLTDAEVPSVPMSLKERPYLSNTVNLFPLGKSSDSFATLASNPSLCFQQEITSAGGRIEYPINPCNPAYDGAAWHPDYLYHFTRYASYWRGGLRFFMHFCCDQFTSCRFRVGISYKAWNADWADSGDVPSVVVDVHGSTYYSIMVPYLHDEYWQRVEVPFTSNSTFFPRLYIEALDDPVGSTLPATPKITVSLFRAAAPDYQLAEPGYNVAYNPPPPPPPRRLDGNSEEVVVKREPGKRRTKDVAQCSLEAAFSKTFPSIVPNSLLAMETGLCMPETMDSPAQLCKRVCVPAADVDTFVGIDDPYSIPHWYLNLTAEVFAFWRGSRRVSMSVIAEFVSADITTGVGTRNPISPAVAEWYDGNHHGTTVTLPYYATVPYRVMSNYSYTGPGFQESVTWFADEDLADLAFRFSAGDDLVCGHLIAPRYQVDNPS